MDAGEEIRTLKRALHLRESRQDWGIANSDPSRVEEFIRYCSTARLTPSQQFAMGELVIASTNDALAEGLGDVGLVDAFERFLGSDLHGLPSHIRYWSSLDGEEFPVAALLRRMTSLAS